MPATPSNVLNTNLLVGGVLASTGGIASTGNVLVTGDLAATGLIGSYEMAAGAGGITSVGNISSSNDITSGGTLSVSGEQGFVVTSGVGSSMSLFSSEINLPFNTSTSITDFGLGNQAGDMIVGATIRITAAPAGLTGTTICTFSANGGVDTLCTLNASPAGTFSVGSNVSAMLPTGVIVTASGSNLRLRFFGGADDTPSSGSARVVVYYWRISPPTS